MPAQTLTQQETTSRNLPGLRRYARALAGGQQAGDDAVSAAVSALFKSRGPKGATRIGLFQWLAQAWNSAGPKSEATSGLARQALLLAATEGFSLTETAAILRADPEAVEQWIGRETGEMPSRAANNVLIIEDEPLVSLMMQDALESCGHHVSGVARTRAEAEKLAGQTPPDFVVSSMILADGSSGIEALNDILRTADVPYLMATTPIDQFLTGKRSEFVYLLAKPFTDAALTVMVDQAILCHRAGLR
jgi:CheY-like chemotaxis protein